MAALHAFSNELRLCVVMDNGSCEQLLSIKHSFEVLFISFVFICYAHRDS